MKKIIIYLIGLLICIASTIFLYFMQPRSSIVFNKASDIKNISVKDDYYINEMNVSLIDSYPINSSRNYMKGDSFIKGYHNSNTMFIFEIKKPKNLSKKIEDIQMKKGKFNIPIKKEAYQYGDKMYIFVTADTHINDLKNYHLTFKMKNDKDKDVIFEKKYDISNLKGINTFNKIMFEEITKVPSKESYFLMLTKKIEVSGMKYEKKIEMKTDIKMYPFGRNQSLDTSKIRLMDKSGRDVSHKYMFKASTKGDAKDVKPFVLELKIYKNSTDDKSIRELEKVLTEGSIVIEK